VRSEPHKWFGDEQVTNTEDYCIIGLFRVLDFDLISLFFQT
jgi:hypothetical protein